MPPAQAAGETVGAGARAPLRLKQLQSLAQALRQVPDPRVPDGRQYPLWAILTVLALGLLLGRKHLAEMVRDGQRLSQAQRRQIGFHRGQRLAQFVVQLPGEVAALVLPHVLQVGGKFCQIGGALPDLKVKLVALALQGLCFARARLQ